MTIMSWPNFALKSGACSRAATSDSPPALNGMMYCTGFSGYPAAAARPPSRAAAAQSAIPARRATLMCTPPVALVLRRSNGLPRRRARPCVLRSLSRRCSRRGERGGDGLPDLVRARLAAEVSGARPFPHDRLDGGEHVGRGARMAEVVEHHGARPDLADRVRDALPGDVGRRA